MDDDGKDRIEGLKPDLDICEKCKYVHTHLHGHLLTYRCQAHLKLSLHLATLDKSQPYATNDFYRDVPKSCISVLEHTVNEKG